MSRILWQKALLPELSSQAGNYANPPYPGQIENAIPYPQATADIPIPDPRAFRSMSRASVFLSHLCAQAKEALAPFLQESPFSVGIYCAVENGPIDAPSTAKIIAQNDPSRFSEYYRKFRNPKMYLKQLPNLAPAQMGISMGIQGPMNVYTHSNAGTFHALEQAEWDLHNGFVKAALVCSAHAFDDFLVLERTRRVDKRCLVEGAAALVLVSDGQFVEWPGTVQDDPRYSFGISDHLMNICRNSSVSRRK